MLKNNIHVSYFMNDNWEWGKCKVNIVEIKSLKARHLKWVFISFSVYVLKVFGHFNEMSVILKIIIKGFQIIL